MNTNPGQNFEFLHDPEFRRSFRQNPRRHIEEMGLEAQFNIGEHADVVVKTNTRETIYIPLPMYDERADYSLLAGDLEKVSAASVYEGRNVATAGSIGSLSCLGSAMTVTSTASSASSVGSVSTAGSVGVNQD